MKISLFRNAACLLRDAPPCHGEEPEVSEASEGVSNQTGGVPQDDTRVTRLLVLIGSISVMFLLVGCASIQQRQAQLLNFWAELTGTGSGALRLAREKAAETVEAGKEVVGEAQDVVEDVSERVEKVKTGLEKIQEGKKLIDEGVGGG